MVTVNPATPKTAGRMPAADLQRAEQLVRESLIPRGVQGRDILNLTLTPGDRGLLRAEGEIVKNNMYGERNLFHFSGLVDLKKSLVKALEQTFEHGLRR